LENNFKNRIARARLVYRTLSLSLSLSLPLLSLSIYIYLYLSISLFIFHARYTALGNESARFRAVLAVNPARVKSTSPGPARPRRCVSQACLSEVSAIAFPENPTTCAAPAAAVAAAAEAAVVVAAAAAAVAVVVAATATAAETAAATTATGAAA